MIRSFLFSLAFATFFSSVYAMDDPHNSSKSSSSKKSSPKHTIPPRTQQTPPELYTDNQFLRCPLKKH